MTTYNTIVIKEFGDRVQEELEANAAITPGMLVEIMSTGKVRKHATSGGNVSPIKVALEDSLQGRSIATDYDAEDMAQIWTPRRGDWGYLILVDGENISIGDLLESNGAGMVQEYTADTADSDDPITVYPGQIIGVAREAKNLASSSGAESSGAIGYNKRILVEFV